MFPIPPSDQFTPNERAVILRFAYLTRQLEGVEAELARLTLDLVDPCGFQSDVWADLAKLRQDARRQDPDDISFDPAFTTSTLYFWRCYDHGTVLYGPIQPDEEVPDWASGQGTTGSNFLVCRATRSVSPWPASGGSRAVSPGAATQHVHMTPAQEAALRSLSQRYNVPFNPHDWRQAFDLPPGYVAGWAGPIYCGCAPDGCISS